MAPAASRPTPEARRPKRLVVCLDGTWRTAEDPEHSTNVVRLMRRLASHDGNGVPQVVFYDKGIGTGGDLEDRYFGGATGSGINANVRDAYLFLGNNYEPGDEIYLFGFSRGAFTARSLAGLIGACGLLGRDRMGNLAEAWRLYRNPPAPGELEEKERHEQAVQELGSRRQVRIACIGVWDTVGALGIPLGWFNFLKRRKYQFHSTSLGGHVGCALQALAIDEKRLTFEATLWQKPKGVPLPKGQVVEQVWFAGCHSDVGGGEMDDQDTVAGPGLADLALEWMIERVREHTSLAFVPRWRDCVKGDPVDVLHESRSALYWASRVAPFQRVLGGHGRSSYQGRFPRLSNRPDEGNEFINEALHGSVRERWGKVAPVEDGGRVRDRLYRPANVGDALDGGMRVVPWSPEGLEKDFRTKRGEAPAARGTDAPAVRARGGR